MTDYSGMKRAVEEAERATHRLRLAAEALSASMLDSLEHHYAAVEAYREARLDLLDAAAELPPTPFLNDAPTSHRNATPDELAQVAMPASMRLARRRAAESK